MTYQTRSSASTRVPITSEAKMVYDWEGKEEECYRLYVEERKPLDEVMEHFKNGYGFSPSKRAYQTQFKRWEFPSKQNPAHKNEALVARVKELWEINTSQKDMLRIVIDEGFSVKERELMRLRTKHRWLLRVPNGMKSAAQSTVPTAEPQSIAQQLEQAIQQNNSPQPTPPEATEGPHPEQPPPELPPETLRKRKERMDQLQVESDSKWAARKRRRRTRGWAGLPADPDGPPRFPSETTIDESKAYLSLDNDLYCQLREQFEAICREEGVLKKTVAGPEKWLAVKDRLIAENSHLRSTLHSNPQQRPTQAVLSLDVICTDVTKRLRTLDRKMTIADAKNALGVNPEQSRQIRHAFYALLEADRFAGKLAAGDDHWQQLKARWVAASPLLQAALAPGPADPDHGTRVKAVEVLCRDVMKRLRDDQARRDPSVKKQAPPGPGPGPAKPRSGRGAAAVPNRYASEPAQHGGELQIDPTLLLAASDPSLAAGPLHDRHHHHHHPRSAPPAHTQPAPLPVFLKLHPHSAVRAAPDCWLGLLTRGTMGELRALAAEKHAGARVARVEGVVRDASAAAAGRDVCYCIDDERELAGYLAHVSGGQATFVVRLVEGEGAGEGFGG